MSTPQDLPVPLSWQCNSYTKPNPDIAGVGIIISILVQSFFVVVVSFVRWLAEPKPFRAFDVVQKMLVAYTKTLDHVLLMLSDVQGFLGCTIIIAALSQAHSISLYHIYMVWALSLCISTSHYAAIHFTFSQPTVVAFRKMRLVIIGSFLGLFIALSAVGRHRFWSWGDATGRCYRWHTFWPLDQTSWFIIAGVWTVVPYFTYFLPKSEWYKRTVTYYFKERSRIFRPHKYLYYIVSFLDGDLGFGLYTPFWFAINAYAILGVYLPSRVLLVDGEGSQDTWGFGQVSAMCAVPWVMFEAWQIWSETQKSSINGIGSQVEIRNADEASPSPSFLDRPSQPRSSNGLGLPNPYLLTVP